MFFSHEEIENLLTYIVAQNADIRQKELCLHFKFLHPIAVRSIMTASHQCHLGPDCPHDIGGNSSLAKTLAKLTELSDTDAFRKFLLIKDTIFDELERIAKSFDFKLLMHLKMENPDDFENKEFLFVSFPNEYIQSILQLTRPRWYVACFMDRCDNPSVWGHYANGHRDVCLKFKVATQQSDLVLPLKRPSDVGEPYPVAGRSTNHHFYKVTYQKKYPQFNFFASLGCIPMADILQFWFAKDIGEISDLYSQFYPDMNKWRSNYWDTIHETITTKLEDWSYEREYRFVMTDDFHSYKECESRKFVYEFDRLDGIIFGLKTSNKDKFALIDVLKEICKKQKRANFNLYQAYYNHKTGKISHHPL